MTFVYPAFKVKRVIPLHNRDYYEFLMDQFKKAKKRIWGSIFIINLVRTHDPDLLVRSLLNLLSDRSHFGIDVKIISGISHDTVSIDNVNEISRRYLNSLRNRIDIRKFSSDEKQSTHNKFVIIDEELIILGSHNWTDNAFNQSIEDSIAIYSPGLCKRLEKEFLDVWHYEEKSDES